MEEATARKPKARQTRGVLMTATASKRGSWRDQQQDVADSDEEPVDEKKASQLEWAQLERDVQSELQKKALDAGIRHSAAVDYDDVASDEEGDEDDELDSAPSSPEAASAAAAAEDGERVVPEGVTTAGDQVKVKKRSGVKRTGAEKRKRKFPGDVDEEGQPKKKKKKEDDPDRWLKMRLEGEEKPKKIDATRVVHYHDFDRDAVPSLGSSAGAAEQKPAAAPGGFRSMIRRDMFDGSDDDDD